jgi:hypothetical protein
MQDEIPLSLLATALAGRVVGAKIKLFLTLENICFYTTILSFDRIMRGSMYGRCQCNQCVRTGSYESVVSNGFNAA